MNYSKVFLFLIIVAKNLSFFSLTFLIVLTFNGCDLFGDEEHCQYEAQESKIWTPSNHFVRGEQYASKPYYVEFEFNLGNNFYQRNFQINNVCPLGAIATKIRLFEKESIIGPHPIMYHAYLCESVQTAEGWNYIIKEVIDVYKRVSPTELQGEGIEELIGLPEQGSRTFFVTLSAVFSRGLFNSTDEIEAWAKENVTRIEFYADFTKYE